MDKLNLYETLRIYLPGLLFSFLFYFLFFPSFKHLEIILFSAIFVGLILDTISKKMYNNCFRRIEFFENFRENLKEIILAKLDTDEHSQFVDTVRNQRIFTSKEVDKIKNNRKLIWTDFWSEIGNLYCNQKEESTEYPIVPRFLTSAYFAKKNSNQEIYRFRYSNSLGQMYYNFSFVTWVFFFAFTIRFMFCLIEEDNCLCLQANGLSLFFSIIIMLLAILLVIHFMRTGKSRFRLSIKSEISYWTSVNNDDVGEIASIIKLWEDLYKNKL